MKLLKFLAVIGSWGLLLWCWLHILERSGKTIEAKNRALDKYISYYHLNNKWISLKESGERVSRYFKERNLKKIALYGLGDFGVNLNNELTQDGIEISYAFDKNLSNRYSLIPIKRLNDELPTVDAIVITVAGECDAIKKQLSEVCNYQVITIEEVLYSL